MTVPTLYVEFSGDAAAFPSDADRMYEAILAEDKTRDRVRGLHFGQPIAPDERTGYEAASGVIGPWLTRRFHTAAIRS